jgi:hypothetical protein
MRTSIPGEQSESTTPPVSKLIWSGTGTTSSPYQLRVLGMTDTTLRSALHVVQHSDKANDRFRRRLLGSCKEVFQAGGEIASLLMGQEKSTDSDYCVR